MEKIKKNIGIKLKMPKKEFNDARCPFHGTLKCRNKIFTGTVISIRMQKTANVEFERRAFISKYERYEKRRTRIKAHNPECINAKEGDVVRIANCRPISKTKNFVIIENLGKEKGFEEKMEALEEGKTRRPKKEEVTEESNEDMKEEQDASSESERN